MIPEICRVYRQRGSDKAYLESLFRISAKHFDRYVPYADLFDSDRDYHRNADTGQLFDRESLNAELEKIEKTGGNRNPKDFRNKILTSYCAPSK
ncbi:hypothetical protein ACNKHX_08790 [Shigella flexneri]